MNKNRALLCCILICLFSNLNAQWQLVDVGTNSDLYNISFSPSGNTVAIGSESFIFYKNGQFWENTSMRDSIQGIRLNSEVFALHLSDDETMHAGGFFYMANSQVIFKTEVVSSFDNWKLKHLNNGSGWPRIIRQFDFPTDQIGFAVGHGVSILKTENGGSTWQTSFDHAEQLYDVEFADENRGFVIGDGGIFKTSDGGANWQLLPNFPYAGEAISVLDANTLYAAGDGSLRKSTDGGNSWTNFARGIGDVNDIFALDANTVLVTTDEGIFITKTAGEFWEVFPETEGKSFNTLGKNGNEFWAVGDGGLAMKAIDLTQVKPVAFFEINYPSRPHCDSITVQIKNQSVNPAWSFHWLKNDVFYTNDTDFDLKFVGTMPISDFNENIKLVVDNGILTDTLSRFVGTQIYASTDSPLSTDYYGCTGNAFILDGTVPDGKAYFWRYPGEQFSADIDAVFKIAPNVDTTIEFHLQNERNCWDTAYINFHIDNDFKKDIWRETTRPGLSWPIVSIDFLDENLGYALSSRQRNFLKTEDGGDTWTITQVPRTVGFDNTLDFINRDTGFVALGVLYRTTDGGQTFDEISTNQVIGNMVRFFNDTLGFVIRTGQVRTDPSYLYRTTDGGNTWKEVHKINGFLNTINCPTPEICYLGGGTPSFSQMLKSENGGDTWTRLEGPYPNAVRDLDAIDENTVLSLHYDGNVYKTTDGGSTWDKNRMNTEEVGIAGYGRVKMIDENLGWLSIGSRLLKTVDGGDCWQEHPTNPEDGDQIYTFSFPKPDVGYFGTGTGGITSVAQAKVYKLTDGAYFTAQKSACFGEPIPTNNVSSFNLFDQFEWYDNGQFFSTEENPTLNLSPGIHEIELIASDGNRTANYSQMIEIYSRPEALSVTGIDPFFCQSNNRFYDLTAEPFNPNYTYDWQVIPPEAAANFQDENKTTLYWSNGFLGDSATVQVVATNEFGCVGDTLNLTRRLVQEPELQVDFLNYPAMICLSDTVAFLDTLFAVFNQKDAVFEWSWKTGLPDWEIIPNDSSARVQLSLDRSYFRGTLEASSENECGRSTAEFNFDLIGPPEFIEIPESQGVAPGSSIDLEAVVESHRQNPHLIYSWYQNGNFIPGERDSIYSISSFDASHVGDYFVETFNRCFNIVSDTFQLDLVSGTNGFLDALGLKISPNPFSNRLVLKLKKPLFSDAEFIFYNEIGQQILVENLPKGQIEKRIDFAAFPKGVYFLSIKTEEGSAIQKLIKE